MYDILDALGEFTIASNGVCTLDEAGHDSPRQADDVTSSPESQIEDLIQTYVIEPKMRALGLDV